MIHIVGAGPGDPELITVKGARYLAEADVVIYAGSLVNPALLDFCKEEAEIHNSAHMTLDEVIEVIERKIHIVEWCAARLRSFSRSGTGVRPSLRVMMTVCEMPGRVYSCRSAAAVPRKELTPGTTS